MLDIKKSIAQGWGTGGLYDILKELQLFSAGIQGEVYFVEAYTGYDGNDGKSWDKAFKTLAVALAASHANIGASKKGGNSRNTIFCKGDFDEDLTILARKTNIVGVGSCNEVPCARLTGTHIIPSTVDYAGCHFYNFDFRDDGNTANFTIEGQIGLEFHNCEFDAIANCTYALYLTTCNKVKIMNCKFFPVMGGAGAKFTTGAIGIIGTTIHQIEITGNIIYGAKGIYCASTTVYDGIIKDNLIVADTFVIDDDSDDFVIVDNRMITAANGTTQTNVLDYNVKLAAGNILTDSTVGTINIPSTTD